MKSANITPHIGCSPEDFAKTVLMPGDPLRAKFIAETYLKDRELVNNVRGVQGYTGYFEGKRVSVMASGMGMPSMGIYSFELYNIFGVETIIRIGSAGGMHPDLKLFDLVLAQGPARMRRSPISARCAAPPTNASAANSTTRSVISFRATCSIPKKELKARSNGRRWACSQLKWKPPRSI